MSKDKHEVSDMVLLIELQDEIDDVFKLIADQYGLSKNEYIIMVTLWDKGPLPMKTLDEYIDIKPYKRTRFYNNLVSKGWIRKVRPADDERTVIVHYNDEKLKDKEKIVELACSKLKSKKCQLEEHFNKIMDICG